MSTLNNVLLLWLAAGDDPNAWALLAGSMFALWGSAACAAVLIWTGWQHPTERTYLASVLLAAGLASLLSHAIAARLHLPRPFVLGIVPAYIAHSASASLPSTHATVMFFLGFAFLLRHELRRAGALMLVLAAVTGWARVYVGVHFPFDILAGVGLAGALSFGFALLLRSLRHDVAVKKPRWRLS